ncbi:MAG: isochorismatase, partial [SAR324 cluster bacterium]|nr:isochorismatase [SAR324 cluster bacterium]
MQVFHSLFLVDSHGNHPEPYSLVSTEDIQTEKWKFNSEIAVALGMDAKQGQQHLEHYVTQLKKDGKYDLTIWPYHAMLGGVGHALVPAVEEAVFFHGITRFSQPDYQTKGHNPLTENYSALCPEVLKDGKGKTIAEPNTDLMKKLISCDTVIIAGQAKSHCVRWTIENLLEFIQKEKKQNPQNIYLLEDCTSPVVVPGVIDYTDDANEAFQRFADAGMHVIPSTIPMSEWPGLT